MVNFAFTYYQIEDVMNSDIAHYVQYIK